MKRLVLLLAVLALGLAAAAWVGTSRARAADDPVSGWLAPSCGDQPSDDPFEGEEDCENDTLSSKICVDGEHFNLLHDNPADLTDLIAAINEVAEHDAALGRCGGGSSGGPSPDQSSPARIGVCAAQPMLRSDGTMGVFVNIMVSQFAQPHYEHVTPAFFYERLGLSCDVLPGYTDAGYKVDPMGNRLPLPDGNFYEYCLKA